MGQLGPGATRFALAPGFYISRLRRFDSRTHFAIDASQKEKKPWSEWNQKEAEEILNDSPWGQIQNDTDTSEMFFQPTADPRTAGSRTPNSDARLARGSTNQATNVKYGIRFLSARPVRQAFIRMIQLRQKDLTPDVIERMKNFAEMPANDSIIIAVTIEGTDKRSLGHVMQLFNSASSGTLKNTSYLERNDGKRIFCRRARGGSQTQHAF